MSKPKRPNRIHGRQKDQQIDKIKQQREEKRLEHIAKLRAEGKYEDKGMFAFVAKHKNLSYSVLTIIAVIAFVVGPAYYAAIQGGPNTSSANGESVLAEWDGGSITQAEAIDLNDTGQRLAMFYSVLVQNAAEHMRAQGNTPNASELDPWSLLQPSDPTTVKFLSTIADQYAMGIKANDIATQIKDNLYEHNTSEQIREAKKNAFGEQKETSEIAELLVPYVAARRMQQLAESGIPTAPAISDRYVAHKMLSTKHQFEVLRIPVSLEGINPPTDSDLEDLIGQRSEWYVDDTGSPTALGLNPASGFQLANEIYGPFGVRSPRKFGYQYVTFNDAAYDRYARVKFEEGITEENLKTYYETNIERYPAPDDVLDAIDEAANGGESSEGDENESDTNEDAASEENTDEATDDTKEDQDDESSETPDESAEEAEEDDCLVFLQEEEQATEEAGEAGEDSAENTDDTPPATTDETENSEEKPANEEGESEEPEVATTEADEPPAEDLTGLDTPIPLEPNYTPEPATTYLPYEEVAERVREDYIQTSIAAYKQDIIDQDIKQLTDAMEAFANAETENGTIHSVKLPELLAQDPQATQGDSDEPDEATKLIQQAEAVLIAEMEKIEAKAEGIMTEPSEEGEEIDEPEQINLLDIGSTEHLISAAYGQAISGRVPGALDFGFNDWDDTSHHWTKLVRIAYQAHGGPGSSPQQDIFLENDFLVPHQTSPFQQRTYVFWQVDQSKESTFEDVQNQTDEVLTNAEIAWKKIEAIKKTKELADNISKDFNGTEEFQTLQQAIPTDAETDDTFLTYPTTTFSMAPQQGQFGGFDTGIQLGVLAKEEIELIDTPPTETEDETDDSSAEEEGSNSEGEEDGESEVTPEDSATEEKASTENTEQASSESEAPAKIEKKVEGARISDINDGDLLYLFEELSVNDAHVASSITGRYFYVIRKVAYEAPADEAAPAGFSFDRPVDFVDLAKYLVEGSSGTSPNSFTATMTANATNNMYNKDGRGTVSNLQGSFIALLQKQYNFVYQPNAN